MPELTSSRENREGKASEDFCGPLSLHNEAAGRSSEIRNKAETAIKIKKLN